MLFVGAASVTYWRVTEEAGVGNLVPYGILQAYSVLIVLLIAQSEPSRYTRGVDIYWVVAAYVIAAAAAIPFEQVLAGEIERLYTLKQDVVSAGIRSVLGVEMPVNPKRRF